jgi:hypothetical protein
MDRPGSLKLTIPGSVFHTEIPEWEIAVGSAAAGALGNFTGPVNKAGKIIHSFLTSRAPGSRIFSQSGELLVAPLLLRRSKSH